MSKLELLLKENKGKIMEFGAWRIIDSHLRYKHDNIYTIITMLGNEEMTFFMSNGLTFELKLENNIIIFTGMSVRGKPIEIEYETYSWI